jgi:hypothetical protein
MYDEWEEVVEGVDAPVPVDDVDPAEKVRPYDGEDEYIVAAAKYGFIGDANASSAS